MQPFSYNDEFGKEWRCMYDGLYECRRWSVRVFEKKVSSTWCRRSFSFPSAKHCKKKSANGMRRGGKRQTEG